MKLRPVISVLLGLLALTVSCGKDQSRTDSEPAIPASNYSMSDYNVASARKEIIAQNVLAAHHEFEAKTTFAPTEPIQASIYLTDPSHIEEGRISALLVRDEAVVDQQNIAVAADEKREEFDFCFVKTPRPLGI